LPKEAAGDHRCGIFAGWMTRDA